MKNYKAKFKNRWLSLIILSVFTLTVYGRWSPDSAPSFLLPQPYSSLYIEVDNVEGAEIPKESIEELKEFLIKYCRKPDGIELVCDDIIPQSECKGRSAEIIANVFIDGPPPRADNKQSAYLYVLVYGSKKMGKQQNIKKPHVNYLYPCTIYYDIDFVRIVKNRVVRNFLLHEAGHTLGLCGNIAHGDGNHCANKGCIMSKIAVSITGSILNMPMKKLDLCADCQKDIEDIQTTNPVGNMSFNGPFLVRREDGYWVASLPASDVVSFSGTDTFDWREMLANMKKYVKDYEASLQSNSNSRLRNIMPFDVGDSPQDINEALVKLAKAEKDPNPSVKIGATESIKKIEVMLKVQLDDANSRTP